MKGTYPSITAPSIPRPFLAALFSTAALAAVATMPLSASAADAARATTARSADISGASDMVFLGGQRFRAGDLIGRSVVTPDREMIGEVVDLITGAQRDAGWTYNDVVIHLEPEHYQMGAARGGRSTRLPGNEAPTVVGGRTVAVQLGALSPAAGTRSLIISPDAITTLREFSNQPGQAMAGGTPGPATGGSN